MDAAVLSSKGQVTIPKDVRDALGLKEHDRLIFVVDGDRAIMKPVRQVPMDRLFGVFKGRAPFPGREVEREAARRHVVEHALEQSCNDCREASDR